MTEKTKAKGSFLDKLPPVLRHLEAPAPFWFELDRLITENEKLRAALKPFATWDVSNDADDRDYATSRVRVLVRNKEYNIPTYGDVRRAHDVLYPPVLP